MMKIKKKLLNPFMLVAQGFVAGAVLFFATTPPERDDPNQTPPVQSAAMAENLDT